MPGTQGEQRQGTCRARHPGNIPAHGIPVHPPGRKTSPSRRCTPAPGVGGGDPDPRFSQGKPQGRRSHAISPPPEAGRGRPEHRDNGGASGKHLGMVAGARGRSPREHRADPAALPPRRIPPGAGSPRCSPSLPQQPHFLPRSFALSRFPRKAQKFAGSCCCSARKLWVFQPGGFANLRDRSDPPPGKPFPPSVSTKSRPLLIFGDKTRWARSVPPGTLRLKFHPANIPSRFVPPRAAQGGLPRENRERLDTKPRLRAPVPPEHPGIPPRPRSEGGRRKEFWVFSYSREAQAEKVLGWDGEGWERLGTSGRDGKGEIAPSSSGERL